MRKLIFTGMAVAMLAIPAVASADVPRCEASVPNTRSRATFTAFQPKDARRGATCGSTTSRSRQRRTARSAVPASCTDNGGTTIVWTETINGTFNADKTLVSFGNDPRGWRDVQGDGRADERHRRCPSTTTWTGSIIEFRITPPVVTSHDEHPGTT